MVFAGSGNEVTDRILHLHSLLGHTRQILQMDVGGMPHATYLKAFELLGTDVLPQLRKELGWSPTSWAPSRATCACAT